MRIVWLREASISLDLEFEYLARKNPRAARQVFKRIVAATKRLQAFPESGRQGHVPGTRGLVITNLPHLVVYRASEEAVEILRVFHAATDWPRLLQ
jgi:toxin ParE1/3/4